MMPDHTHRNNTHRNMPIRMRTVRVWSLVTTGVLGATLALSTAVTASSQQAEPASGDVASLDGGLEGGKVQFNRDIRPILSDNCFACHGPDKADREAGLALHTREFATATLKSGDRAIVPGDPASSEMLKRVSGMGPGAQMPPMKLEKPLSAAEIDLLTRWIEQGAEYQGHWAWLAPEALVQPEVSDEGWVRNPVDAFVLAKLDAQGLEPSPEADRRTLIRRVTLDLTGLPPTPAEIGAFLDDERPDAYARVVDRLLGSPHYGERMALRWLDVARFADTNGYHSDNPRALSPFRDYVIDAFNDNMPFDQFTREQLAGDLLPNPTREQRVASGFNYLTNISEEGGAQPKEYLAHYMADRVATLGTAWMGATTMCAQCHDHKFDPISHKDYYSLGAFFADIDEPGLWSPTNYSGAFDERPYLYLVSRGEQKKLDELRSTFETLSEREKNAQTAVLGTENLSDIEGFDDWAKTFAAAGKRARWTAADVTSATSDLFNLSVEDGALLYRDQDAPPRAADITLAFKPGAGPLSAFQFDYLTIDEEEALLAGEPRGVTDPHVVAFHVPEVWVEGEDGTRRELSVAYSEMSSNTTKDAHDRLRFFQGHKFGSRSPNYIRHAEIADNPQVYAAEGGLVTWSSASTRGHGLGFVLNDAATLSDTDVVNVRVVTSRTGHGDMARYSPFPSIRVRMTGMDTPGVDPETVADLLSRPRNKLSDDDKALLRHYFIKYSPAFVEMAKAQVAAEIAFLEFEQGLNKTWATRTTDPREVRILPRGDWQDETGDIVTPAIPEFLGTLDTGDRRATRLDLADWLVGDDNPLTPRVFVNRHWADFFGYGLSGVLEDLGSQGEWPSHPELLDWLAVEFVESDWDVKHLVRLMVTSSTYRQASQVEPASLESDPDNRMLARQAQIRLSAEVIRDNALAISALLSSEVGGDSVKPYQPEGAWRHLQFPERSYVASEGQDQYRRGMYTFMQRSFVHPSLKAFDAPSRETSVAGRSQSNTPLQALTLLNDPSYVEAARVLGTAMMSHYEEQGDIDASLSWAFERATARPPSRTDELAILRTLFDESLAEFERNPTEAQALLKIGQSDGGADRDVADLAAWTMTARAILNLHETITRP